MFSPSEDEPVRATVNGISYRFSVGWRFRGGPCKVKDPRDGLIFDGEVVAMHDTKDQHAAQFIRDGARLTTIVAADHLVDFALAAPAPPAVVRKGGKRPQR